MARVNVKADLAAVERGMEQAVRDARPAEGETNFKGWVRVAYPKVRELRRKGISWQAIADVLRDQKICHPGGKSMSTGTLIQYMAEIRRESAHELSIRITKSSGKHPFKRVAVPVAVESIEAALVAVPAAPTPPIPATFLRGGEPVTAPRVPNLAGAMPTRRTMEDDA